MIYLAFYTCLRARFFRLFGTAVAIDKNVIKAYIIRDCFTSTYLKVLPNNTLSFYSVDINDEILAGHTLNYEDIQDKYIDKLRTQSKTICLFVQDKVMQQRENFNNDKSILQRSVYSVFQLPQKGKKSNDTIDIELASDTR